MQRDKHWNKEAFLNFACDRISKDLDWDSIDSGRLHHTCCKAKTFEGKDVIVAVFDRVSVLNDVKEDIKLEKGINNIHEYEVWLYVPQELSFDRSKFPNSKVIRLA